jgi:hypothetical protein
MKINSPDCDVIDAMSIVNAIEAPNTLPASYYQGPSQNRFESIMSRKGGCFYNVQFRSIYDR